MILVNEKLRSDLNTRTRGSNSSVAAEWEGGGIFVYSCSHTVKAKEVFSLSKEISNVEVLIICVT